MTDISNNNGPCGTPIDLLRQCKDELRSKKLTAEGTAKASVATVAGKKSARDFQVCFVLKAEETSGFYRNVDYYVAINAANVTDTIQKNVDDLIKKNGDLEKAIVEAAKAIKLIKDKATEAKSKACELDTQMKDPCNDTQLTILTNGFRDNCVQNFKSLFPEKSGSDITFQRVIEQVISQTNTAKSAADRAFSSAVDISGIQTFSNVASLKDMSKSLAEKGKELKADIDKNVKDAATDLGKTQDELAKAVKEWSVSIMDSHKSTTAFEGCAFTLDFVCDPVEPENCGNNLISQICEKVRTNLCGGDPGDCNCGPGVTTANAD